VLQDANSQPNIEHPTSNTEHRSEEPKAANESEESTALHNVDQRELRSIYIIESREIDERLVVFEDGELLRTVDDPCFHAHFEERRETDSARERVDAANAE